MTATGRNGSEAGFTLIETLVTLAVVGFLVVLTSTVLHSSSSTLNKVSHADAEADARSSATSFLRRLLAHAQPDLAVGEGKGLSTFEGLRLQARFLAPSDGRDGVSDIVRYSLYNDERGRLHVAWRLDRPDDEVTLSADDIFSEIQILGFSYFGSDKASATSNWRDHWRDRDDMPREIKLTIKMGGRASEIVVSPVAGQSSLLAP